MAKDVTAAAELIRKKYEGQARMRELSKLGTPLVTEDPRRLFVASCRAEHLVEELARRYGRLRLDKVEDGRATAISEKGAPLSLVRDKYGRWGVPVLRERLERRAVHAANVLKALRGDTFGGARP